MPFNNLEDKLIEIVLFRKRMITNHLIEYSNMKQINGINNESFTDENPNKTEITNPGESVPSEHESCSYRMILSLTFHSLGIIFGDM